MLGVAALITVLSVMNGFSGELYQRLLSVTPDMFLGAFTTFSAFSLDVFKLIETQRMADAMGYVAVSVIGAIVALFIGVFLAKGVLS